MELVLRARSLAKSDLLVALAGSILIAIFAQIAIPLPFTPVLLTGQPFGVIFVGALFGSRLGCYAVLAYLMEGALGLPVFAGGASGAFCFFGLSGGYLWGFPAMAYLVGHVTQTQKKAGMIFALVLLIAIAQLVVGALWLSVFVGAKAIPLGFTPFLSGAVVHASIIAAYQRVR